MKLILRLQFEPCTLARIPYFIVKPPISLSPADLYFRVTLFLVGIVIRLRPGRSGVRIPAGTYDFSCLQNIQTGSWAQTASYSVGTGFFPWVRAAEA